MFFLALIIIGLAGMALMSLPGLFHGHLGFLHRGGHAALPAPGHGGAHLPTMRSADPRAGSNLHIPSPGLIFSLIALYGACGYALQAAHVHLIPAALFAVAPALLLELVLVKPLWNLLFRFQGTPSAPLSELVMQEASAVTPFRNQRGMVRVTHNGRIIQFQAVLVEADAHAPVEVGDRLQIESVDSEHERLTVSVI